MKKKIAYVINHSAFFYSHIYNIAHQARKNNYEIKLFCGEASSEEMNKYANFKLKEKKIKLIQNSFKSSGVNLFNEIIGFLQLIKNLKKYEPDIIHCATPKGILFGGLASKILKIKSLVIFNSGMGFLFSNKLNFLYKIIKILYLIILKKFVMSHKNKMVVVENKNDYDFLKETYNLYNQELKLVKGSGVDLKKFKFKIKNNFKSVLLPARVIKEKGIEEFIIASKKLKKKYPEWRFQIAGTIDYEKVSKYSYKRLNLLNDEKQVEFLGYIKNIIKVYDKTSIVCLPSYREGFSKTLQEAAAKGLPIVTTRVTGCRDAIIPGKTGLLCNPRDSASLKKALQVLILDKKKRLKFGLNGRKLAEKEFNLNKVIKTNIFIYDKLVSNEK